ncbi:MAG: hypothetical protein WA633_29375 [Stellaceae bacterium]
MDLFGAASSAFRLVLFVPQGVVEIEDTLTESGAARVDTQIGTRELGLRPIILMGAHGATRREQCGEQINMMHDIFISILRGDQIGLSSLQRTAVIA